MLYKAIPAVAIISMALNSTLGCEMNTDCDEGFSCVKEEQLEQVM